MSFDLEVGVNTYVDMDDAKDYLAGSTNSAPWDTAAATMKTKALATAARALERCTWSGTKTDPAQALSWPRTGVVDKYGNAVSTSVVPQDIINAEIELALAILNDPNTLTQVNTMQTNKMVKAGTVEVEFFRLPKNLATQFPKIIQDLIGPYISGVDVSDQGATAYDNERCAKFEHPHFEINKGF